MTLFAIKLSDTEWLSAMKVGVRITNLWWEGEPKKALRFGSKTTADAVCSVANAFYHKTGHHVVIEIP